MNIIKTKSLNVKKVYYENHKEKITEINKLYRGHTKDTILEHQKYVEHNKEHKI